MGVKQKTPLHLYAPFISIRKLDYFQSWYFTLQIVLKLVEAGVTWPKTVV